MGTSAESIRVRGITCAAARITIDRWMDSPKSPVDGFAIDSPARFQVHGRRGSQEFWFALRGTD